MLRVEEGVSQGVAIVDMVNQSLRGSKNLNAKSKFFVGIMVIRDTSRRIILN